MSGDQQWPSAPLGRYDLKEAIETPLADLHEAIWQLEQVECSPFYDEDYKVKRMGFTAEWASRLRAATQEVAKIIRESPLKR